MVIALLVSGNLKRGPDGAFLKNQLKKNTDLLAHLPHK